MKINKYIFSYVLFMVLNHVPHGKADVIEDFDLHEITITISAEPRIKNTVLSSIENEIKKIPDLKIASNKKQWVVDIITFRSGAKDISCSITIRERLRNDVILQSTNSEARGMIEGLTSEVYYYNAHWIESGSMDEIEKISSGIISKFDSHFLEKRRRAYKSLKKLTLPSKQELGA